MAKTKIDKDDIKRLVENTSNPTSTTSVYSAKYVDDNFLKEITKAMVEAKLTGDITSHDHDTTYLGINAQASDSAKLDDIDSTGFAQLEDGKIKASNLPDYLLGQVLYGGSINASQACTLSSLYKDKFDTTTATILLTNLSATPHVGVYFIASGNFILNGTIDVNVGDWVISDGITWGKIDNTDAVASVNGQTGVINLDYEDLGDIPQATNTKVGGIMLGYVEGLDADLLDGKHASDFATSTHTHDTYLGISAQATDSEKLGGKLPSYYEPAFTKKTAFNEDFGTGNSDVARGDHGHNYTTSTDVSTLINTAIASVYKPKGNIANKTALLALTNIKQGDVYNAQTAFTLINGQNVQNVKIGDNIVCLADATTSIEANWDNLGGNIDFAVALSQALVGFSATSGNISSSNTILEAINMLAYDKHTHTNKTTLDDITAAFTTALKTNYDNAVTNSHTHDNKAVLDAITNAVKTSYDGAVTNSHTHTNKLALDTLAGTNITALNAVTGTNTGDETTQRIGTLIDSAVAKTTPIDADMVGLMDSAANKIMKKLSWANLKSILKDYLDNFYTKLGFYTVKVGSTYITAASNQDTIEFVAGTNVTLDPDVSGKKLTIAATGGGGSATYREIKVNGTSVLGSSDSTPINIRNGVGTTLFGSGFGSNGDYVVAISAHMGVLTNLNGVDLQSPGIVGVWTLLPGQHYLNAPNPICGTDVDTVNLSGTYTYVENRYNVGDSTIVGGGTWTYHDQNTNKMYISSWYNDPVNGDTINPWKRLLTCKDEIATEPDVINTYEYVINSPYQLIYIDTGEFDVKEGKMVIDLAPYSSILGIKINIGIHFTPDIQGPVNIDIQDTNGKLIQPGSANIYTDTSNHTGNIYHVQYEIWNLSPYWLVGNDIYG